MGLPGIEKIGYSLLCAVAVVCVLSIDEILNIGSYFEILNNGSFGEILHFVFDVFIGFIWVFLGMFFRLFFVEDKFIASEANPRQGKVEGYYVPNKMRKYMIFPISYICVSIYLIYYGMFNLLERIGDVLFILIALSLMGAITNWMSNQSD